MRKTMIVALARKWFIALWHLVTTDDVPAGISGCDGRPWMRNLNHSAATICN